MKTTVTKHPSRALFIRGGYTAFAAAVAAFAIAGCADRSPPATGQDPAAVTAQTQPPQTPQSGGQPTLQLPQPTARPVAIDESAVAAPTISKSPGRARVMSHPGPADVLPPPPSQVGRDRFERTEENSLKVTAEAPISTFSIDVDTASYSFVRGSLNRGVLPQKDAVRIEEMANYFDYAYPLPDDKNTPFRPSVTVFDSPWAAGKKLLHIGIKGFDLPKDEAKKANLVFLLDVSGSMGAENKLPLVKQSMLLLLNELRPDDTVAIVAYAAAAGVVLQPTPAKERQKITAAIRQLQAGGGTAGGAGIQLAYQLAESNYDADAVNRVVLATDGDFNIGIADPDELTGFVERKRESGVYLSVLGFGHGNYHDLLMQSLAQNGNGVAAYIDTLAEAQKILVEEASSTLFPIARDVKIQVEFNPAAVAEYRLIGYETRILNREDFNNDAVDAGDIGAGHSVTALYELTPVGSQARGIDPSRYGHRRYGGDAAQSQDGRQGDDKTGEYGYLKIRYKLPAAAESKLIEQAIPARETAPGDGVLLRESRFAAAVAGFAQILKGGKFISAWTHDDAIALAQANKGEDRYGYRAEFIQLVRRAKVASEL